MGFEINRIKENTKVFEYLAKIGRIFDLKLEIVTTDKKPVIRSFSKKDSKSADRPLYTSPIILGGEETAHLNIYGNGKQSDNGAEALENFKIVGEMVKDKLEDYYEIDDLSREITSGFSEKELYQILAEEALQHDNMKESLKTLLRTSESVLKTKKFGVFILDEKKENMELIAYREDDGVYLTKRSLYPVSKAPFQKVFKEARPIITLHAEENAIYAEDEKDNIAIKGSLLAAPLKRRKKGSKAEIEGVIFAIEPQDVNSEVGSTAINAISTLASLTSVVIHHYDSLEISKRAQTEMDNMVGELMSTFETLQQKTALIEQVNRISMRINSTLDLDVIFDSISDYSKNLLLSDMAIVGVMTEPGRIAFPGIAGKELKNMPKEMDISPHPMLARTFEEGKSIIVNEYDPAVHKIGKSLKVKIRNFITCPIKGKEGAAAVIVVFNKQENKEYLDVDSELLNTLAGQAQTAIENARLLNNIKETQFTMMSKLAELAEKRDPETGEHLLRMQKYCMIIARELSNTEKFSSVINRHFINEIYAASPLHDIGKVGINDSVLLKPGKLNAEEWKIMKTHASIGADILKGPDYLEMAAEIAEGHHEKWDGSGYPNGTSGEDIPVSARIVAVSDVYDALTSKRVYKEGFSHEKAMEIIEKDTGKHFDPDMVEALKANEEEVINIKDTLQ